MTDFIKVTDTNEKVLMVNKKHIFKVESFTNDSGNTFTRITFDLPDNQRDLGILLTRERFETFIGRL